MSAALYPEVTNDFLQFRDEYGSVDKLDTRIFLTGPKVNSVKYKLHLIHFYQL